MQFTFILPSRSCAWFSNPRQSSATVERVARRKERKGRLALGAWSFARPRRFDILSCLSLFPGQKENAMPQPDDDHSSAKMVLLVLGILGGVFLMMLLVCGGVIFWIVRSVPTLNP